MDALGATEPTEAPGAHQDYPEAPTVQKTDDRNRRTQHENDDVNEAGDEGDDNEDEDEDDEEPQLKYAYLTKHLGSVYRNGDAASCFLSAGDKMVCNPRTSRTCQAKDCLDHWDAQWEYSKSSSSE